MEKETMDKENKDKENIDQDAFDRLAGREYLQAYFWGELSASEGRQPVRLLGTAAGLSALPESLPGGAGYYYIPRGPRGDCQEYPELLRRLATAGGRPLFLRIEPENPAAIEALEKAGFRLEKTIDLQPRRTLMLDLTLSEAELSAALSQKTRYNIRLAAKKGVSIIPGGPEDFEYFWKLMSVTGARDAFNIHGRAHYRRLIEEGEHLKLYFAAAAGKKIAAGIFCFFGGRATYLHGASSNEARNLMAPHLLQWTLALEAKARGCSEYDFYGIDDEKWPGVTRFKRGFGGFEKAYPGTYDVVLRPAAYAFYERLRRWHRALRHRSL